MLRTIVVSYANRVGKLWTGMPFSSCWRATLAQ